MREIGQHGAWPAEVCLPIMKGWGELYFKCRLGSCSWIRGGNCSWGNSGPAPPEEEEGEAWREVTQRGGFADGMTDRQTDSMINLKKARVRYHAGHRASVIADDHDLSGSLFTTFPVGRSPSQNSIVQQP